MRFQLIILTLLISFSAIAVDDKSMQELFKKYDLVMDQKKIELVDEVFTKKFIRDSGGKKELVDKIKELTVPANRAAIKKQMTWKKGQKGELYLAKVKKEKHETEFIVIKEDGKLKIEGTLSDGD
jgi:hypothetical protein